MENHNWADIKDSPSAPYINGTLLPMGAHAEQYFNPPGIHPSEPNYIWLEAGDSLGIVDDLDPAFNHRDTPDHLVNLLEKAGRTWKSYQEGISGDDCPLTGLGLYIPRHNPMLYFDDVTDTNSANAPRCIAHVRPFAELAQDLASDTVPDYSFITPNVCNDMHNACWPQLDSIKQGDDWLAAVVPMILASKAYQAGGVLFITWDEGEGTNDGPIGMIVLSPRAKAGYSNAIPYTHSATLRTVEELLGVSPLLRDAATSNDLGDLFVTPP
jgi:hypothetical protein